MHYGESAGEIRLGEVGEIFAHLCGGEHALVNDVLGGKGADVEVLVVNKVFHFLPYNIKLAFQVFGSTAGDEHLLDVGLGSACILSENVGIDGHTAYVHELQPFAFHLFEHDAKDVLLGLFVFGEEYESCTVTSFLGYGYALKKNEFVWDLQHDARAVACFVVGAFCSAVLHVFKNLECGIHEFVVLCSVNVDNHTHAACVVLVVRIVKSLVKPLSWLHNVLVLNRIVRRARVAGSVIIIRGE